MKKNSVPKSVWKNPIHFIACGFGSGVSPWAPGTAGTLVAIPFYLLLQHLSLPLYAMMLVVTTLLGFWLCDVTAKDFNVHDHPGIVWDEMVGYWLTMFAAPTGWCWIVLGFALFRLFDIWKPWPISWLDKKVSGGIGIMVDDLVAAVFAFLILQLCALIF